MKSQRPVILLVVIFALILACNLPSTGSNPVPASPLTPPPTSTSTLGPSPTPKPLDLAHQPLYWFAPLPAKTLEGETDGSTDFMDLFKPDAPWATAASDVQVFKLYGGWAVRDSTTAQLTQAVAGIRQRGLALAVEVGPLNPTETCGLYLEGFAGDEGIRTLERIKSVGGEVNLIAFDEPYFNAHFLEGAQQCLWSTEDTARKLDTFIRRARQVFPNVIVGDIEPLTGKGNARAYNAWIDAFKAVNGYDLAFLHIDVAWAQNDWPSQVKAIEQHGRARGVPVGMIYDGNFQDPTDEAWVSIAGERAKRYELESGGQPAHVVFQSWNDKPDLTLPETNPYSFTGFIKTYFEDKHALGFRPDYFASDLAYHRPVQVSVEIPGFERGLAVDGDLGTWWSAGRVPPNWIQIDLGGPKTITAISLVLEQWPAGETTHQVWGGTDPNHLSLLHEFQGHTQDPQTLEFKPAAPWTNVRYVKIVTTESPSWTSWREIQILGY